MSNILDSVRDYLSPELLGEAANIYGENEAGIAKAIGSLAPTILAGLLEKSGDSHAIDNIFSTLRNFNPAILDNLGSLLGGGNLAQNDPKDISGRLLSVIFGAKIPAITNAVASFSGIKQSSASSLLGLAGPLVMALLSKKISAEGLNASKLVGYLLSQRNTIISLLPAGCRIPFGNGKCRAWQYKSRKSQHWHGLDLVSFIAPWPGRRHHLLPEHLIQNLPKTTTAFFTRLTSPSGLKISK